MERGRWSPYLEKKILFNVEKCSYIICVLLRSNSFCFYLFKWSSTIYPTKKKNDKLYFHDMYCCIVSQTRGICHTCDFRVKLRSTARHTLALPASYTGYHRAPEGLRLAGASGSRAGCPGSCPGVFGYPQGGNPTGCLGCLCQGSLTCTAQKGPWCSDGASCVPGCAHCLPSHHWTLLGRGWPISSSLQIVI